MTKPPIRPLTGDENLDRLLRMNTELLSELWILRDRVMVLEKILEEKELLDANAIDDYAPSQAFGEVLQDERDQLVRRVAGAPWIEEFTWQSLVERRGR
ncbi:MAG: hypothetical protein OXC70_08480 [Gammaproteobacteria bacterium]|nr:hypothetical protein [Gammaproteobacteria bacterium]